jgi:hypothetical protein
VIIDIRAALIRGGALVTAAQIGQSTGTISPATAAPAWKTIPSWAVIGTAGRLLAPAEQLALATRAGAHITKIDAPHLAMVADPSAVTQVINEAAHATAG